MTGTWTLTRFALRRERLGLPIWVVVAAALVAIQSVQSQDFYADPAQLASLRTTAEGNPALLAMTGPVRLLETVGGEAVFEIFSYVATVLALMSMVLVIRHTRADEEAGRAELVRSARVGRRAPLTAALVVAALANTAAGALAAVAAVATGLPLDGSALLGAALASVGLAYAGLTAAAVQVFDHTRGVSGVVIAALGASWALRGAGDVGDGTLSWLSPIGWGQRTYPYVDDRWWPLLLPVGLAAVSTAAAVVLLDRRDLGAGPAREQPGPEVPAVQQHHGRRGRHRSDSRGGCSADRSRRGRPGCSCWGWPTARSAAASRSSSPTTPRSRTSCRAGPGTSWTRSSP